MQEVFFLFAGGCRNRWRLSFYSVNRSHIAIADNTGLGVVARFNAGTVYVATRSVRWGRMRGRNRHRSHVTEVGYPRESTRQTVCCETERCFG
jgi:hypothetical protein